MAFVKRCVTDGSGVGEEVVLASGLLGPVWPGSMQAAAWVRSPVAERRGLMNSPHFLFCSTMFVLLINRPADRWRPLERRFSRRQSMVGQGEAELN